MGKNKNDTSLEPDVTGEDAERHINAAEFAKSVPLADLLRGLSEREFLLLQLHYVVGLTARQIADELGEEVPLIRFTLNATVAKLRYRARKIISATSTDYGRWSVFQELQRRVGLTTAKAAEWQNAVTEARR
jgi:DNA-directed RNA polymerase specialized sigma24 family protein